MWRPALWARVSTSSGSRSMTFWRRTLIQLLLVVIICGLACVGFGAPWYCFLGKRMGAEPDPADLLMMVVIGLASLGAIVDLLNFLVPITPLLAGAILFTGGVMLLLWRRFVWKTVLSSWGQSWPLFVSIASGLAALVAWLAQKSAFVYDAGLYYLQTLDWIEQSRVPLGLANLHGRLGYNSLWFSVVSAFGLPELHGRTLTVASSLLFAAFSIALAGGFLVTIRRGASVSSLFLILTTIPFTMLMRNPTTLGSGAPDAVVAVIGFATIYLCIRGLEAQEGAPAFVVLAFVSSIFAVTVKLSALPLISAPVAAAAARFVRERRSTGDTGNLRWMTLAVALSGVLIGLPWMMRGLALSGCLAYPISSSCFHPLSWAVPDSLVKSESMWIRSWAREPGVLPTVVLASWDWFPSWLKGIQSVVEVRRSIALLGGGVAAVILALFARRLTRRQASTWLLPLVAPAAGVFYWFFTAPDPRFGLAYIWSLSLLVLAGGLAAILAPLEGMRPLRRRAAVLALGLSIFALLAYGPVFNQYRGGYGAALRIWSVPLAPAPSLQRNVTANQAVIWSPATGNQCWDAPLPCTPYYHAGLEVVSSGPADGWSFRTTNAASSPFAVPGVP